MNIKGVIFLLMLVLCSPTWSQSQGEIGQPISYRRGIPREVRHLMPRGAKSLFWGTFTPEGMRAAMGIHVTARYPEKELVKQYKDGLDPTRHFAVDVFDFRANKAVLINHRLVAFRSSIGWGSILIRAKLFWLDLTRRQPLIVIESFTKDGYFAGMPYGEALFLSFIKGWRGGTALQTSNFGASNNDAEHYWIERTPAGHLQIKRDDGSLNAGDDAQGNELRALLTFVWKKRRFVATPASIPYLWPQDSQFKP